MHGAKVNIYVSLGNVFPYHLLLWLCYCPCFFLLFDLLD